MNIVEFKYEYQVQKGELSAFYENAESKEIIKLEDRLKESASPEIWKQIVELIDLLSDASVKEVEKAYKVGFKDGVKTLKEIEAIS